MKFSVTPIIKATAAGNDFLIIDLTTPEQRNTWDQEFSSTPRSDLVVRWCDRHFGLGADGVVFLEPDEEADFRWDFYNSDGGRAELCGNATRAVALYWSKLHNVQTCRFQTVSGLVHAEVRTEDEIEVNLPPIGDVEAGADFVLVNAGVPHAVVSVDSINNRDELRAKALSVKQHPRFQAKGVNVTFLRDLHNHEIESVTFERGVEDFTLACGTGAVSAATVILKGQEERPLKVHVPGGDLTVVWKKGAPHLIGPARIIGEMRWRMGD